MRFPEFEFEGGVVDGVFRHDFEGGTISRGGSR